MQPWKSNPIPKEITPVVKIFGHYPNHLLQIEVGAGFNSNT